MRDLRLDPADIENIALAYRWLTAQPYVNPTKSGLLGTCVGGSFALMASAHPLIRDQVSFVSAYAPFSSMRTLARDIASSTRLNRGVRERWQVDQLTRKVYVRSMTDLLEPDEAEILRNAFADQGGHLDSGDLSEDGRAIYALLTPISVEDAEAALERLPTAIRERLTCISPMRYVKDIRASLIIICHDRGDQVIPVGESRRLATALSGRAGFSYTELGFQHLDPTKLPLFLLLREMGKFYLTIYPLYRRIVVT
jgi:dipeptidyl aminopeptidase/acylaminoacyl peptidase